MACDMPSESSKYKSTFRQRMDLPKLPHTLSAAAPTKAAQIRSAVTGSLIRESNGLLCFEHTVETTFLLPWDLNPKVWP